MARANPPQSWSRVTQLFHQALDRAPEHRIAFLQGICGDDRALYDEVRSLLEAHDRAADFIEQPAGGPAARLAAAMEEPARLVGQQLGQYRIGEVIGEGGMGVVYRAEDTRLGRAVALKALAPRFTRDPAGRERLRREARAAASLTHPGIATVYALEEFGDDLFIAGEYVPGQTLRDELTRGPQSAAQALETTLTLARAVAAAHDRGVVHRDLKPENVIRTPGGELKILDFGLARVRGSDPAAGQLTAAGVVLGTPAYMSPEQIRSENVDGRSDLFALGAILYELVAGENPFYGPDAAATLANVLEREPAPLATKTLPEDRTLVLRVESVVTMCLRKSPAGRFQSAHDLVHALERAREGSAARASGPMRTPSGAIRAGGAPPKDPLWWWQFHQAATSVAYAALLVPMWLVHEWTPGTGSLLLFLAALVAALVSGSLRTHLWFTVRSYPEEWASQHASARPWILVADVLLVAALVTGAALVLTLHASVAVILVGAGVAALVSALLIEPATTRAAFGRQP